MLFAESREIFKMLLRNKLTQVDLILNLGSSTNYFRAVDQPYINQEIFDKLDEVKIIHSDIKKDLGVDLVGDIMDDSFKKLILDLNPKVIICSNLLEHVINLKGFSEAIIEILPVNSFLLITTPKDYPYHPDPIDTMFRPSIEDLKDLFPELKLVDSTYVDCGVFYNACESTVRQRIRNHVKAIIRILMPFYKPFNYKMSFEKFNKTTATITLFKKIK